MERVDHLAFAVNLHTQQKVAGEIDAGDGHSATLTGMDVEHTKGNGQTTFAFNHRDQIGIFQRIIVFRIALKAVAFGNDCLKCTNNLINGRFGFLVIDRKRLVIFAGRQIGLQGCARNLSTDLIGQIIKMGKVGRDIAFMFTIGLIKP
jgi:hypothetical protein